ncbi:hypothetical protein [Kordiimonas sp.]|uniref:hypothetical protein n=1 Tax=Kordiimonas sp. TaxID=1970157 RepID=UPI003A93B631
MKKKTLWPTLIVALMAFGGQSLADGGADDGNSEMTRSEKRLARIMDDYKATGKTKSCVPLRFLRDSTIIDDQTIFFKSIGKKAYMNRLPHKCSRLASEERFMYSTSISSLCRMEIITVLDSFGRRWGSCGLGEFEEMEKLSKAEKAERDASSESEAMQPGESR